MSQGGEPITAFSPRVDPESRMPYMPSEPIDLMTSGGFQHIPWIAGITDDEGAFKVGLATTIDSVDLGNEFSRINHLSQDWSTYKI